MNKKGLIYQSYYIPWRGYCKEEEFQVADAIRKHIKITSDWLLSLRCDNDDMLSNNFVKEMKNNFRPLHNMYIDFIRGYNLYAPTGELNSYKSRSNHFIGYVENTKVRPFETVLKQDHSIAKEFGYMRRIDNKKYPLWCEVTHETNRLNTFKGKKATLQEKNYFKQEFTYKAYIKE